jgi:hypothetical protein
MLLDLVELPAGVEDAIRKLIEDKKAGTELGLGPRIELLDEWIMNLKEKWNEAAEIKHLTVPTEELNNVFRRMLEVTI